MQGSTLYRRMPDGTWVAQREDPTMDADAPADYGKILGAAGLVGAGSAIAASGADQDSSSDAGAAAGSAAGSAPGSAPGSVAAQAGQPGPGSPSGQPPAPGVDSAGRPAGAAVAAGAGVAVGAAVVANNRQQGTGQSGTGQQGTGQSSTGQSGTGQSSMGPSGSATSGATPPPASSAPSPTSTSAYPASGSAPAPSAPPVGPPSKPPAKATKNKQPRGPVRIWLRRIVVGVLVVLGAYAAWIVGLLIYATVSLNQIEALSPNPIPDTDGQIWLLVGSDSREGLTPEQQKELHTGDEEGQRTDTIMLAHMRPGETPRLVSLPRDSWVTIPSHTASDGSQVGAQHAKINAAFSWGGAPLLSETIEYNTGLHIDHYIEISMYGVVALTDAVGGIEVCFEEAIQDEKSGLDVEAGCQVLNGEEALAWVRMRYSDPKGDLGRIERQQEFVKLIMEEILSLETITHPGRQLDIVNAILDSVFVDLKTGSIDLGRFGIGMGRIATGKGEVTTVPLIPGNHNEQGQSVVKWDEAEAEELFGSMGGLPPQAS